MKAIGYGTEILEETVERCAEHGDYKRVRTREGWRGRCPNCRDLEAKRFEAVQRAQRVRDLLTRADLPLRFARKSFANYAPSAKGQEKALATCKRYADEIDTRLANGTCLVLIGPPGVGKTHLLVALARAALEREIPTRYATMMGFLATVKGAWEWHGEELGAPFVAPRLLVLDEVWMPNSTREAGSLMALLDERYRRGRPTLVASNLSWPQMQEEIGARFCDRLLEGGGVVVPVDGKSARGRM